MSSPSQQEITQMLLAWSNGDESAFEKLTPVVYQVLHRIAYKYRDRERIGHTLQTTALVHEAFLRLIDWKKVQWQTAEVLKMAPTTVRRDWSLAQAWLHPELSKGEQR
ncbi:MAG TPA: ECF-type sigma factor [Blastocatellia bacterium]|nr:ECF-type sigma factor [Blastocatellia bacterium]